jgi:cytochrome d ubiquinol oxidase subunit II
LAELPLIFILVGLAAYVVLGGADFGAGIWVLASRRGEDGVTLRDHARHAMGPVWEANHVWLIFVLVVCWTAYPSVFGSITSTLSIPLFIAAVGIILRGTAYAVRAGAQSTREEDLFDRLFGLSSILTPFALGAVVGGIASGRVPPGNAKGDQWSSWLNPTSAAIGVLTVAMCAYLAAVFLAADARRLGEPAVVEAFKKRAVGAGVLAGALAVAALPIVSSDAERIWDGLTSGWGLVALAASGVAGVVTLLLVRAERFEPARGAAAVAVAAIIAGWALAQRPYLLPGVTVDDAAAGHSTLVAVTIGVAVGAVILLPSLAYLFTLVLRGRFDRPVPAEVSAAPPTVTSTTRRIAFAGVCLVVGTTLTVLVDPGWGRIVGVTLLAIFLVTAFPLLAVPDREEM